VEGKSSDRPYAGVEGKNPPSPAAPPLSFIPRLPAPAISRRAFSPASAAAAVESRARAAASVSHARADLARRPLPEGKGWKLAGGAAVGAGEAGVLQLLPTKTALESGMSDGYSREAVF
jgi:hypothetical protein